VFERFTERARQVVVLAQEEARALRHNYIGTEHILLGLIREEEGLAATALRELDVQLEDVRAQVVLIVGRGGETVTGQIPFTPRAKKVLELALRERLSLGHDDIGTEHILLGLARENEGVAARILYDLDAGPEKVFEQLGRLLSQPISSEQLPREPQLSHGRGWVSSPERSARGQQWLLVTGWLLFAAALGVGVLIGWAIWGH
jgi:ATP-dependent Clp protease ATP-binding subunit ClpC